MEDTLSLGTQPIGKLLIKYSIPAVLASMVNAIYNVVDRIFISFFAGEGALAGLSIAYPIMMILLAFATMIGAGGAALLAISFGKNDQKGASQVFGNTLSLAVIITVLSVTLILFFMEPLLVRFGANGITLVYATDYLQIIVIGVIFQMISFCLNSSVRAEGKPKLAMVALILAAVTNIVLDYIFIAQLDWGVQGAAFATVIGQASGLALLLTFYIRRKSVLHLSSRDFIPKAKINTKILSIGFATFITLMGMSLSLLFLNRSLVFYGGTSAVTAMGAIYSIYTLVIMPLFGLQQALQPIIGYNYGARQADRVYRAFKLALIASVVFSTIFFILLEAFPVAFMSMFLDSASETMSTAVEGLRLYVLMLPLLPINIIGISFFQSITRAKMSIFLGVLRQIVFLIPLVIIIPQYFGLTGVWLATPVADALAILISVIALVAYYKKYPRLSYKNLPDANGASIV